MLVEKPGAGPEPGDPTWRRPQRATEPLPPPPSGYRFAAPDYLYAPRPEEPSPAPAAPQAGSTVDAAPPSAMVWSVATSTWVPATPPSPPPPHASMPRFAPLPPPAPPLPNRPFLVSQPQGNRRFRLKPVLFAVGLLVALSRIAVSLDDGYSGRVSGSGNGEPLPAVGGSSSPEVGGVPLPVPAPSTEPPESPPAVPPAVLATLGDLITAQAYAVWTNDESRFLATVDPKAKSAVATYRRIFENLRALRASHFSENAYLQDLPVTEAESFTVTQSFCIGAPTGCAPVSAGLDVKVAPHGMGVMIESVAASTGDVPASLWMATPLTVASGGNVVVAASPDTRAGPSGVLPVAETAATRADAYSTVGQTPRPYVVFLGTHADVTAWFGKESKISNGAVERWLAPGLVVMVLPEATTTGPRGGDGLAANLQRALAGVVLSQNGKRSVVDTLTTGLRAYAAYFGLDPDTDADTLAPVHAYVDGGSWGGHCYFTSDTVPAAGLAAMPGVGLLAMRYFVGKYGFDRAMKFWTEIEQEAGNLAAASWDAFGAVWTDVNTACARYVVSAVA